MHTWSSVSLSDAEEAEVSVSAGLLSVDLRRHSQLRRSIPGGFYASQCGFLLFFSFPPRLTTSRRVDDHTGTIKRDKISVHMFK